MSRLAGSAALVATVMVAVACAGHAPEPARVYIPIASAVPEPPATEVATPSAPPPAEEPRPEPAREPKYKVRLATLAPKNSPWGRLFQTWTKALGVGSNGDLGLEILWNGVGGNDRAAFDKVRAEKLDGAVVGLEMLATTYRNVHAVEVPILARQWADVDGARLAIQPDLERALAGAGMVFAGWNDFGAIHLMTKGYEARTPAALSGRRTDWLFSVTDLVSVEFLSSAGVVIGTPPTRAMGGPPVHGPPTGDTAVGPSWMLSNLRYDHWDEQTLWCATGGATVFNRRRLALLPADLEARFERSSLVAHPAASQWFRKIDAQRAPGPSAPIRVTHSRNEVAQWDQHLYQVSADLTNRLVDKVLVNHILKQRGLPPIP